PALLAAFVPPLPHHGPRFMDWIASRYARLLPGAVALRWPLLAASVAALILVSILFVGSGAEFVPRIFEGDAVVTIRRAPSISLDEARALDLAAEKVLHSFPEVVTTLGMTGRAEVAVDPVGNDNTDLFVRLRPLDEWTRAH